MGPGRSHGVQLGYELDDLRGKVMVSDGEGSPAGPRGNDAPWYARDTEWAITARSGIKLAGNWKQFTDQQSWPDEELGILLGGAIHVESGEYGTDDFETDVFKWTADCTFEFGGANLFAAVYGSHDDSNDPAVDDRDMYAFQVQGGVFLTDDLDVYARYEWGDDDSDADDLSVLTVGFNRYWYRHNVKFTADVGYAFNGVGDTWQKSLLGWRADTPGEDGQIVLRTQLQLLY
jgi:hypothetical protein